MVVWILEFVEDGVKPEIVHGGVVAGETGEGDGVVEEGGGVDVSEGGCVGRGCLAKDEFHCSVAKRRAAWV